MILSSLDFIEKGMNVCILGPSDSGKSYLVLGTTEFNHGLKLVVVNRAYMNADQTITLSEKMSQQPHGIVLVWSVRTDSGTTDTGFIHGWVRLKGSGYVMEEYVVPEKESPKGLPSE